MNKKQIIAILDFISRVNIEKYLFSVLQKTHYCVNIWGASGEDAIWVGKNIFGGNQLNNMSPGGMPTVLIVMP